MESERRRLAASAVGHGLVSRIGPTLFPHHCLVCGSEGRLLCCACLARESTSIRGVFSCPVCGRPAPLGTVCAGACRSRTDLAGAICLAPYGQRPWSELLHEYKYNGIEEAGETLEQVFSGFLKERTGLLGRVLDQAVVTAAPLHFFRQARRGFNQADRFASAAGRIFGAEYRQDILVRRFRWRSQVGIRAAASRKANAAGSVACRIAPLSGRRCVVVDDVLTTGATISACAAALKAAGFSEVWGLTLLRS